MFTVSFLLHVLARREEELDHRRGFGGEEDIPLDLLINLPWPLLLRISLNAQCLNF
jgi:hypothetical protein